MQGTLRTTVSDAANSALTDARAQITSEMKNEFVKCTVDTFIKHYMPFAPTDEDVKRLVSSITQSSTHQKPPVFQYGDDGVLKFTAFLVPPESQRGRSEDELFEPFSDIANAISSAGNQNQRFTYQHCPNNTIRSDIPGSNNRIDACFRRTSTDQTLRTSNIAVPIEHKIKNNVKNKVDNNTKVVSMNVQIMNDDVRRMFTFGVTMESANVTLFFHSRSHSAISESFSFVEDPRCLIRIFMSFMFASDEDLGYDPTVTRHEDGTFTYELADSDGSAFYRTVRHMAAYRSNKITSRVTRVWLVAKVDSPQAEIEPDTAKTVLKDVWLHHDAPTEKEILDSIFADIEAFWNNNESLDADLTWLKEKHTDTFRQNKHKDYFLTIIRDCIGQKSKTVAPQSKKVTDIFVIPETHRRRIAPSNPARHSVGSDHDMHKAYSDQMHLGRAFEPRQQYRVVFKEVCVAVNDLKTVGAVINALSSVLIPLQFLLGAGWVHRDISAGNIMVYGDASRPDTFQIKLADLEYAKRYPRPSNDPVSSDPKTGTPYYMAHEILNQRYIYLPDPGAPASPVVRRVNQINPPNPLLRRPVVHNFLHDIESLWWILLRTITVRTGHETSVIWAEGIFQNSLVASQKRQDCFLHGAVALGISEVLKPSLSGIEPCIDIISVFLLESYLYGERNNILDQKSFYALSHKGCAEAFAELTNGEGKEHWESTALAEREAAHSMGLFDSLDSNIPSQGQMERSFTELLEAPDISGAKDSMDLFDSEPDSNISSQGQADHAKRPFSELSESPDIFGVGGTGSSRDYSRSNKRARGRAGSNDDKEVGEGDD